MTTKNDYSFLFSEYPEIVTVKNLMDMLQICKSTAYSLINNKTVDAIRIGSDIRVIKKSIIEFINKGV